MRNADEQPRGLGRRLRAQALDRSRGDEGLEFAAEMRGACIVTLAAFWLCLQLPGDVTLEHVWSYRLPSPNLRPGANAAWAASVAPVVVGGGDVLLAVHDPEPQLLLLGDGADNSGGIGGRLNDEDAGVAAMTTATQHVVARTAPLRGPAAAPASTGCAGAETDGEGEGDSACLRRRQRLTVRVVSADCSVESN